MTFIRWISENSPNGVPLRCPNCYKAIARRTILQATVPNGKPLRLFACNACTAHFFVDLPAGDYANDPPGGGAALAFYLQQGANMGAMAVRLAALGRPSGTRYLEIGCGFGISLDIARRALGWDVRGIDPSPFAAAGREQLGLPIDPRYLMPDDPLAESFDVVHASEVLEHVANPLALLTTLRNALRPDGTLVLTTPAAECIVPGTSDGLLIPLLSAGWHVVLQTAASLEMVLRRAGFSTVRVRREGAQLIAIAGAPPRGQEGDRGPYLAWLAMASAALPRGSDLSLGLGARLYRECSSAGDAPAAKVAWTALDAAVKARFGRGMECLGRDPPTGEPTLDELVRREPVCLGGVLLHRGLEALQRGEAGEEFLSSAIAAAGRLRAALRAIGSDDGDAEDVAFVAERELTILAAQRGDPGIADRIKALASAGGLFHAEKAGRSCFVTLVNSGALEQARCVHAAFGSAWRSIDDSRSISHEDASIAFCRAVLELNLPGGQPADAVEWLRALRTALVRSFVEGDAAPATVLYWPATEAQALGLRLSGDHMAAAAFLVDAQAEVARVNGFPSRPAP